MAINKCRKIWHQSEMFVKYRYCNNGCSSFIDPLSNIKNTINALAILGSLAILTSVITTLQLSYPAQAETGKGTDVFRVILTIFNVDESMGDVIAIVTANNEAARLKLLNASGPEVTPINASEGGGNFIEYVATFPNVVVNSGDEYKACVATVKDLELICKTGNNSPAARPEFIDLSLNASSSGIEQGTIDEADNGDEIDGGADSGDEDSIETTDEGIEDDVSTGIPSIG
jgi:hypothetical protein